MSWPVIAVAGGPRERGRAYGERARDGVHRSLELYERVFFHHTGMRWPRIVERAGAFAQPIDDYDVRLLPELEGIAEGAAVEAEDILVLNVRTEVMFGMASPECTAVSVPSGPDEDAHVLLAQNWDWKPGARETCVLLVVTPHDGEPFATFVEAGLLAKCGLSGAGVGVAANALTSTLDRGEPGVPFHAILRRILTAGSFDEAVDAVTTPVRASSGNYLLASRDGRSVDLETAPGGSEAVHRIDGPRLAHANHFLGAIGHAGSAPAGGAPGSSGKDLERFDDASTSVARQASAQAWVVEAAERSVDDVLGMLSRHEPPICRHTGDDEPAVAATETIAAVVVDLTAGALWITDGRPCTTAAQRSDLRSLVSSAA